MGPGTTKPQRKQQSIFHHGGTEFAELGVFVIKTFFSAPSVVRQAHHVLSPSKDAPPR